MISLEYYIVTYDIAYKKRIDKVRKIIWKYFRWVQKLVFEGKISLMTSFLKRKF